LKQAGLDEAGRQGRHSFTNRDALSAKNRSTPKNFSNRSIEPLGSLPIAIGNATRENSREQPRNTQEPERVPAWVVLRRHGISTIIVDREAFRSLLSCRKPDGFDLPKPLQEG
jgi:hypothetical protein